MEESTRSASAAGVGSLIQHLVVWGAAKAIARVACMHLIGIRYDRAARTVIQDTAEEHKENTY